MSATLFPQYAEKVRTLWLAEYTKELLAALRLLDLPMTEMLSMLPEDKATAWLSAREEAFLKAIETDTGLEWERERLKLWETGAIPGIPAKALHPADVPLFHSGQRSALQKFIGRFHRDPAIKVELITEIDAHYQLAFAEALQTYTRMKLARA
jgi:hypothetical protein